MGFRSGGLNQRTFYSGKDLVGRFAQECIAQDDGIVARLCRVNQASRCHDPMRCATGSERVGIRGIGGISGQMETCNREVPYIDTE